MKRIVFSMMVLSLGLMMILSACSSNLRLSEEAKLKRELRKFENFSGSGIMELSAFGFSIRKPFMLAKSLEQMRLDMVEGGVFGATGSPLLSVYLGQYLSIKSTLMPALEALNLQDKLPGQPGALFNTADYVFDRYGADIIRDKTLELDGLKITFRKNYQLESIVDADSGMRVDASYTGKGDLDEVLLRYSKGIYARMVFDKVSYDRPQILPLPKPEPNQSNLLDIFKQGGMMDLLKGLLGN